LRDAMLRDEEDAEEVEEERNQITSEKGGNRRKESFTHKEFFSQSNFVFLI